MSDAERAAINRPMTDDERELMMQLAVWVITEQTGASDKAAADWLDDLNEREGMTLEYDTRDAYIKTSAGKVILHCEREWLSFFANHPDEPVDVAEYAVWFKDGTPVKAPHPNEDTE